MRPSGLVSPMWLAVFCACFRPMLDCANSPEGSGQMSAAERIDGTVPAPKSNGSLLTVKVYTRHTRSCPKRDRPDWARCNCVKWLYIYRDGKDRLISAKT